MLSSTELDDLPVVVKFILQSVADNEAFEVTFGDYLICAETREISFLKTSFLELLFLYFFAGDQRTPQ